MRTTVLAAAAAAALSLGAVTAEAAPFVVVAPAATPHVVLVAGGCGPGFHRGAFGRCLGNGVVVARVLPLYRGGVCVRRLTAFGWRRVCR